MLRITMREGECPAPCPEAGQPYTEADLLNRLLTQRGIVGSEERRAFLSPTPNDLHDPYLLNDMGAAVTRIRRAAERNEYVTVFGDYDVDGVSAAAILCMYFKKLGIAAEAYIPSRHSEGYGLNIEAVSKIAEISSLMVTVDCGVSEARTIERAQALGLDVIVTDHHQPGSELPDCPVINPLIGDTYPYPSLCGAGVAFKLVQALGGLDAALEYVDLAALATVADIVPLTGENRIITRLGLAAINAAPRPGMAALISSAGLSNGKAVTSYTIAYQLAPRINAGGRVGDASRGLWLLTGEGDVRALAEELEAENSARKDIESKIIGGAEESLKSFDFLSHSVIALAGEGWNPGVIGLAASRLVSEYNYPVILASIEDGNCVGSCRSVPGVDIYAALSECADMFVKYGGHKQAAGFTMAAANFPEFARRIDDVIAGLRAADAGVPVAHYDLRADIGELNIALVRDMEAMQPFGYGNPAPVFLSRAEVVSARSVGRDGAHLKLMLSGGGCQIDGIAFGMGGMASALAGAQREVLYAPQLNVWNDVERVQMDVKGFAPESPRAALERFISGKGALIRGYLDELEKDSGREAFPAASPISEEEVARLLTDRPQGTLVAAYSPEAATAFLRFAEERGLCERFDALVGVMPEDRRAYNALCMCPVGTPARYSNIILVGAPPEAPTFGAGEAAAYLMDLPGARADWMRELPDIDTLRSVYVALRRLGGISRATVERLTGDLAGEAQADEYCVYACLKALERLKLISLSDWPPSVALMRAEKCEPESDAYCKRLAALRRGGDVHAGQQQL